MYHHTTRHIICEKTENPIEKMLEQQQYSRTCRPLAASNNTGRKIDM